jgi:hypothetical protein
MDESIQNQNNLLSPQVQDRLCKAEELARQAREAALNGCPDRAEELRVEADGIYATIERELQAVSTSKKEPFMTENADVLALVENAYNLVLDEKARTLQVLSGTRAALQDHLANFSGARFEDVLSWFSQMMLLGNQIAGFEMFLHLVEDREKMLVARLAYERQAGQERASDAKKIE